MDRPSQSARIESLLQLRHPPIAMTFRDTAPDGVAPIEQLAPSSCTFWTLAAEGKVFYTEAKDHARCPIGAYTHGAPLAPAGAKELDGLVKMMVDMQYLRMEEVPQIPHRTAPLGVIVYGPLARMPVDADVVLLRGTARQVMLVAEAARALGLAHDVPAMGRPACAVIPEVLQAGRSTVSLGCIGNRVYTGLGDEEMYVALPGDRVGEVAERLGTIVTANEELARFHGERKRACGPATA